MNTPHDQGFYSWTAQQDLPRAGLLDELDTGNRINKLIDIGASRGAVWRTARRPGHVPLPKRFA